MYYVPDAPPAWLSIGANRFGPVYFRDEFLPLDHCHGRVALEDAIGLHANLIERLGLAPSDLPNVAYLDIETGGPGSHPFLIGLGTFEGYWFRIRQLFLADPAAETAMLAALSETLERCKAIITYNGRGFDLPQLEARYAVAGVCSDGLDLPHIDLLPITRRLFQPTLGSCRLGDIERRLLKFKRHDDDVPGSAIPALYTDYLRRANLRALHPVFEHNLLDVLSLPATLGYLNRVAGEFSETTAERHLTLGRWDEKRGRVESATMHYRRAWQLDAIGHQGGDAVSRLAHMLQRSKRWDECVTLWRDEREGTSSPPRKVRALFELAQLHERRLRQRDEALLLYEKALELVQASPPNLFLKTRPRLEQRLARLQSRLPASPRRPVGS